MTRSIRIGPLLLAALLVAGTGGASLAAPTTSPALEADLVRAVFAALAELVGQDDTAPQPAATDGSPDPTKEDASDGSSLDQLGDSADGASVAEPAAPRSGGGNGDDGAGPWPER